jgi:5'(3')-deoxyribonucleotidase/uncharacterized protein with PQ loop repeat
MPPQFWIAVVGTIAAVCTTLAFVPQIVKVWRQGGRDLSYGMLSLFLIGVVLWFVYGVLIGAREVIAANAATLVLVVLAMALKWWIEASGRRPGLARRPRIAIDMDEVVADTLAKQLQAYNAAFGTQLRTEDIAGRGLWAAVPDEHGPALREMVRQPGFFRDIDPFAGCRDVVRDLAERYEVFIASAATEVPTSFGDKFEWLQDNFPFIPPSHIVFCGDKAVLDVDYLIDDTPRHFERFRGTPILFSAPHNLGETRFVRAQGWEDVRRLFLGSRAPEPRPGASRGATLVARSASIPPAE